MIKSCSACGVHKDLGKLEIYPYPEDECLTESPILPLLIIECQGKENKPNGGWDFRIVVMCHECWHRLVNGPGIDMWIGESCWGFLNPSIPFDRLPGSPSYDTMGEEKWNPANYSPLPIGD